MKKYLLSAVCIYILVTASAQTSSLSPNQVLARSIFKELIEINTTNSAGNTTIAAQAIAQRLMAGGFAEKDIQVIGPESRNQSLVARLHGSGGNRPVLFLAHLDVVEARREDWTVDPFILTEKDGYFYGRGTVDIKSGAAILIADFIRLKQEGYMPDRDLILALTAGEEGDMANNGVQWLISNKRALINAEYCINMDDGSPRLQNGKLVSRIFTTAEKGYMDLRLEVKSPGGHSAVPPKDNAIYHLAKGLTNLATYDFPVEFNATTKSYFYTKASMEIGQLAADMRSVSGARPDTGAIHRLSAIPLYNAMMRSTCVATMLEGGLAPNALPPTAAAKVNCRIMPGDKQEDIVKQIISILDDSRITVIVTDSLRTSPPSELNPALLHSIEHVTRKLWPGVPVIPAMIPGTTDGMYLRASGIPTYGVSGVPLDLDDARAHGQDERVLVKSFYDGLEYEYWLLKAVSGRDGN